jgi:hypothetical protein
MLNRDTFQTDPNQYRLANQGVAKISFPPPAEALDTLHGELSTFVCDGAYANGLARILEAFLGAAGKKGINTPAVWISGFYGSGKSHLASMLSALWTNLRFPDGATAEGLIPHLPPEVTAPLKELRIAATRMGGAIAAGDTLGTGPADPAEATLGIILRAVGLPTDLRAAKVALWLASLSILDKVRSELGATFHADIRNFILSPRFAAAVLKHQSDLANDVRELGLKLTALFPEPPTVDVNLLQDMGRQALMLDRKELPLTLVVLDEVQQFIRQDPALTLKIQTIAERLSAHFDGRVLLVATGQQALSDVRDLQKLLDRFPVQIALGESDVDAVIRKTVLRKKLSAEPAIKAMLDKNSGEISRHLHGSRLAHSIQDDGDAVLDWPLLPSRRHVWERILRELDRTGLGGTLRGQLLTSLDAARTYADRPLGHAVPADFLYGRFATDAFNAGQLPAETRNRIEFLRSGPGDAPLKARVLMMVYMLGRIAPDADVHGVRAQAETIADLLVVDLTGEPDLRQKIPMLLQELQNDGAVIEVAGEWRLQTRESAEWETAYRAEEKAVMADQSAVSRSRRDLLTQTIESALAGAASVPHGASKQQRRIHRLQADEKSSGEGLVLRLHNGWQEDIAAVEKEVAAASPNDPAIHLLIPHHRREELAHALTAQRAAEHVLQVKGVPQTDAGREAQSAMQSRAARASAIAQEILREAVVQGRIMQPGGQIVAGAPSDAVKDAARNALARLYPQFADGNHAGWDKVLDRARRKDPDAMKAVDHASAPETHPVCKALLAELGPGRKGSDLRGKFTNPPFGWPQDAVDAALTVLTNAGQVRVIGEDGRPTSLPDLPRAKIGPCIFRSETTIVTIAQRLAVGGLLTEAGISFEKGQEAFALPTLLDRLEAAAKASGGQPPAPESDQVPNLATLRGLPGNDLLAQLAADAQSLRAKLKQWREAAQKIGSRLPNWRLIERLVQLGAMGQAKDAEALRNARSLLADPDPLPPLLAAATQTLRERLNAAYGAWEKAWNAGQERLAGDTTWNRLTPAQKHDIRSEVGLLPVEKPSVDTPQTIAEALTVRDLSAWDDMAKAVATRADEALAQAAALLEPKARTLILPGVLLKNEADLEMWLEKLRERIKAALNDGPVIPKV